MSACASAVAPMDTKDTSPKGAPSKDASEAIEQMSPKTAAVISKAKNLLKEIFDKNPVCKSHGLRHAVTVMVHARRALRCCPYQVPADEALAVLLAALLHDADDRKFFPKNLKFENAVAVVDAVCPQTTVTTERAIGGSSFIMKDSNAPIGGTSVIEKSCVSMTDRVITMIGYVSAAKNRDTIPEEAKAAPWVLFPRYADRLDAYGWTGVVRCWEYTLTAQRPLFIDKTPRATTEEELAKIATPERYAAYVGDSPSMIDHYYDKLLHIGAVTGNAYLDGEFKRRRSALMEIAFIYGKTGKLPDEVLEEARKKAAKESAPY